MMKKTLLAAVALAAIASTQAQAATYAIDPTHTFVTFEYSHFGTSTNRGRFDKKEGTVEFDRAAKTGKVSVSIDMGSINTGTAKFDSHVKSGDFFSADKFPTAKFEGDKFVFDGDKVKEVQGNLTFLGKTHPITLSATNFNCYENPMLKREVCGGDFKATVKSADYGMPFLTKMGMSGDVPVVIQIEAIKQ